MASKPAVKAYNPYAIKKVVGKTSMKFLAAQASAKAVAEVQAEKEKPVLDESIASSKNDCIENQDSEPDIIYDESPSPSRCRSSRYNPDNSIECVLVEKSKKRKPAPPVKKGRSTRAEKALKAADEKVKSASKQQREKLMAALLDAEEDVCPVDESSSLEPPLTVDAELITEPIMVLWKHDRHKFNLRKTEPFVHVFEEMAEHMETTTDRVLIFCNLNPSHTVNPLDTLNDIGKERVFLSAFREDGSAEQQNVIPEAYRLTFNVQSVGAKARTKIEADKRAALKHFMEKYCATAGIKFEKVVFIFDGDNLNPAKKAEDYDMEDGEIIDAQMI